MIQINLRDYYPFYESGYFVEVSDEVVALLLAHMRNEAAYRLRAYRHKAYYSLDQGEGIEHDANIYKLLCPIDLTSIGFFHVVF